MVYDIMIMITESLSKIEELENAEKHVEIQEQIGLKTIGLMCSLNYVKCIIKWIILERL